MNNERLILFFPLLGLILLMLVLYFFPAFSGLTFMDKTSLLLTFSIAVFAAIEGYATFKRAEMELNRHRISDARNELEKAYGPLYTLLNKTKPSSTEEDAFWLDYEEREKVDEIFATYPFMFSAAINTLWQEKIRNYKTIIQKHDREPKGYDIDLRVYVELRNLINEEYARKVKNYRERLE